MEIDHLRDILAIERKASFAKAASERAMAQSTLSKRVAACETELGIKIFERTASGACPTPLGSAFLESASGIVRQYDEALEKLHSLKSMEPQSVRILTYRGRRPTDDVLATVIVDLKRSRPLLTIECGDLRRASPTEELHAGNADACEILLAKESRPPQGLGFLRLYEEPVVAVFNPEHRLASRDAICAADLNGETLWVPFDQDFAALWEADLELLERFGCSVNVEYREAANMAEAISLGFDRGVQLMAASQWASSTPLPIKNRYCGVPIVDEGFAIEVMLAYQDDSANQGLQPVLEAVRRVCEQTDFSLYQ